MASLKYPDGVVWSISGGGADPWWAFFGQLQGRSPTHIHAFHAAASPLSALGLLGVLERYLIVQIIMVTVRTESSLCLSERTVNLVHVYTFDAHLCNGYCMQLSSVRLCCMHWANHSDTWATHTHQLFPVLPPPYPSNFLFFSLNFCLACYSLLHLPN